MQEVIERQIDNDGTIEDSYRLESKHGLLLKNKIMRTNMDYLSLLHDVELVSYHPSDNYTFDDETVCVIYNTLPTEDLIKKYNLNIPLRDYYGVKINLKTGNLTYKFYREITDEKLNIPVDDYILGDEFGIGFYPTNNYEDFYFYTKDIDSVYKNYGFEEPEESKKYHDIELALFGITINDDKVIKVKRYIYPNDLGIKDRHFIYGIGE